MTEPDAEPDETDLPEACAADPGGGKTHQKEASKSGLTTFPETDESTDDAPEDPFRDQTVHPFRDLTPEQAKQARETFAAAGMDEAEMLLVGFLAGLEAGGTISGRWRGHPPEADHGADKEAR